MVTFVGHDEPRVKVSFRYAVVQNRCLLPVHDIYDLLHGGRRVVFDARCSANVNTVIILGQTIRNSKSFGYILWLQIAFSLSSLRRKQIPPLPHRCLPGGGDRLTPSPPRPHFSTLRALSPAAHLKADVAPCRSSSRSTKALVRPRSATCSASWLRPSPTNTRFSAWGWGQFHQVKYFIISKAYRVRGFKAAYLVRRRLQVEELHLVVLRAAVRLAADGLQQVRGGPGRGGRGPTPHRRGSLQPVGMRRIRLM